MAHAGYRFEMPDGSSFLVARSSEQTHGEVAEVEFTLVPGGHGPPAHRHAAQTEEWEVLEGTLSAKIGGDDRTLQAGEKASISPGTAHTFGNRSDAPVRVRDIHAPALGFDDYIETLGRLVEAGKVESVSDLRSRVYLSMLWRDHRRMQTPASPLLRGGMAFLAGVGRLLRFEVP